MRSKKRSKGGIKKGAKGVESTSTEPQLSQNQKTILRLIKNEFLTPKQVAKHLNKSESAVYKTINKLKNKGVFEKVEGGVKKDRPSIIKNPHQIRLHGIEYNIKILWKNEKYSAFKNKSNTLKIDGDTIRLFENSIEVYIKKDFISDNINKSTADSINYFNRLCNKLENHLNIIIKKNKYSNIKLINSHYAEMNNELARECNANHKYIRVYTKEDGKLWFMIDNSFNLNEAETIGKTSKRDMGRLQPFFNDVRDNEHLLPSEIAENFKKLQNQVYEIGSGLKTLIDMKKPLKTRDEFKEIEVPDYIG